MSKNRLLGFNRRDIILARQILHGDSRQVRTSSMLTGMVYRRAGTATRSTRLLLTIADRGSRQICPWLVVQLRECFSQILGMYLLVRRIFQLDFPSVWRRRRWRDEE